jgi:hypothetical protein
MNDQPALRNTDDDWLDAALRADGAGHRADYLADEGFTARVMDALPPPVTAAPSWRRPVVMALWGIAAIGVAVAAPGAVADIARESYRLLATQPVSLSGIASTALAMIGLTWVVAAWSVREADRV